jgi:general secretion pathway protein A
MNSMLQALGLHRHPFPPTPDAESYFYTPQLESDLAEIRHCILARKGFVLVTGEVGLGKSTLVRRLLASLQDQPVRSALVLNTFLQDEALLDAILADFGLPTGVGMAAGLTTLNQFLLDGHRQGITSLLVIDDAQNLSRSSLELVRLLCNLETAQEKLLQILLVGQPELEDSLNHPSLRQLQSRIVHQTRLRVLQPSELPRYFDFRINAAGADGRITLASAAAALLYRHTRGNVRRVHLLLDRCLYGLIASHRREIDSGIMRLALADTPAAGIQVSRPLPPARRLRWLAWTMGAGLGLASVATWALWSGQHRLPDDASQAAAVAAASGTAGASMTERAATPAPASERPSPIVNSSKPLTPAAAPGDETTTNVAASALADPVQTCFEQWKRLGIGVSPERPPAVRVVDEPLRTRLAQRPEVCLYEENGQTKAAWPQTLRADQIAQATEQVRLMQKRLRTSGWPDLPVDGLLGPMTKQALAGFQRRMGLAATGQPDEWTLWMLEDGHATR